MLLASNSNFLIPNWTFVAELIIFLIVLAVMARVVLPPLARSVTDRADGIRRSLEKADALRADARRADAERRRVLAEAREQARDLVDGAMRAADEERAGARRRGEAEQSRRLDEAKETIATERAAAGREMARNLETLVVAAAERVIGAEVDPSRHAGVIAHAAAAAAAVGQGA